MCTCLVGQVTLASLALWRYTELTYTCQFSVYIYNERGIETVLEHYVILYKYGMNIVTSVIFVMLLFLKILYNKILYMLYQWCLDIINCQCNAIACINSYSWQKRVSCNEPCKGSNLLESRYKKAINFVQPFLEGWSQEPLKLTSVNIENIII